MTMKWFVYNALFTVAYVAMLPSFLLRMKRRGGYKARMGDRFAKYTDDILAVLSSDCASRIWVHAVSVGEVQVAGQLMRAIREADPSVRFVFSTTSSTGWRTAEKEVADGDILIYNPLDFPRFVKKSFDLIRPKAIILTETEIWPNLYARRKREAFRSSLPTPAYQTAALLATRH